MIRIFVILIQIAIVVAVAVWLAERPGIVTINWQGWRIETSFWFLVLALLITVVAGALVYRMWRFLRHVPAQIAEAKRSSRQQRGYKALTYGMVAIAAGDSGEAIRYARRANDLLDDAPLTMLLTAQAAELDGDDAAAKRYFEAMRSNPETAFLGLRGLLNQAVRIGDRSEALQFAQEAHALRPTTDWLLEQLFDLQIAERDWKAANKTLQDGVRHKTIKKNECNQRRAAILVEQGRDAAKRGEASTAFEFARLAHELNSELIPAAVLYAEQLSAAGHRRRASSVLEDAWRHQPNPEIAEAYRILNSGDDVLAQVKRIQDLFDMAPDHVESHVALGAATLAAGLWGEARKRLTTAVEMASTARTCRLMADLEEATNNDQKNVRKWLAKAIMADSDKGWVCGNCGAAASAWSALCGNCDSFNNLDWRVPPRVFALGSGTNVPSKETNALARSSC